MSSARRGRGSLGREAFGDLPLAYSKVTQQAWLGTNFAELTAALPELGRVLTSTRNAHVVLSEYGAYPLLRVRADGHLAADDGGRLFVDFTRWHTALASQKPVAPGAGDQATAEALFSLEFAVRGRQVFQQICLLPDSDLRRFHALVLESSRSTSAAAPTSFLNDAGGEILAFQRSRLPALRARAASTGACGCERPGRIDELRPLKLPPTRLAAVLALAAAAELSLRLSVFGEAAVHTAYLEQTQPTAVGTNGWLYAGGDEVGLHFHAAGIRSLWFTLPRRENGEACLEAYDERGDLLLAVAAARPEEDEAFWRALVLCQP